MDTSSARQPQTRRRCAVCPVVFNGRADKIYCSPACKEKARRMRLEATKTVASRGAVPSVIRGSNGVLIATVAQLGYLGRPDGVGAMVMDVTYGRGFWWTRWMPEFLVVHVGDFRDLAKNSDCCPAICFDPPYISTGRRETSSIDRFYEAYGLAEVKG